MTVSKLRLFDTFVIVFKLIAATGFTLAHATILATPHPGLDGHFHGQKVLGLIPDHTRSLPLPFLFRCLVVILGDAGRLDFMVALGTQPPHSETGFCRLIGITPAECVTKYKHSGMFSQAWNDPSPRHH
jgi:hypothetical protein